MRRRGGEFTQVRAHREACDGCDMEGITCYFARSWYAPVHKAYGISICRAWWQSLVYCQGDLSSLTASPSPGPFIKHFACT